MTTISVQCLYDWLILLNGYMGTNVNNALIMVYRAYYFQYYEICRKGLHYIQYLLLCEINLFSAVYFCNGAQRYEQFLQIG